MAAAAAATSAQTQTRRLLDCVGVGKLIKTSRPMIDARIAIRCRREFQFHRLQSQICSIAVVFFGGVIGACNQVQPKADGSAYDAQTIGVLVEKLGEDKGTAPLHELLRIGKPAIPVLASAVSKSNAVIRARAAMALGEIGGKEAIDPLRRFVTDDVEEVRKTAFSALTAVLVSKSHGPDGTAIDGDAKDAARAALVKFGTKSVDALISALAASDPELRAAAADTLWRIDDDPRVLGALVLAVHDPAPQVRISAAMSLGFRRDPKGEPALIETTRDSDDLVRAYAASALAYSRDSAAVTALINLLGDRSAPVRSSAAMALDQKADPRVAEALIQRLSDEDATVRRWSAAGLGRSNDPRAIEPLIEKLDDPDDSVRERIAISLGELKAAKAVKRVIMLLGDSSRNVRIEAATALGQIGSTQAVEPLLALLSDKDGWIRSSAVESLGRIGDPRATLPLIDALNDPFSRVVLFATEALGNFRDQRATDALIKVLGKKDEVLQVEAAKSLGRTRGVGAVEALIGALRDSSPWVRATAASTLADFGDSRALGPLQKLIADDPSEEVREHANAAVLKLGGK